VYIQPAYEASPHARQVPMRYIDVTSQDELALGLNERVATVPTIVLMRDGHEVDRIAGYTGPHNFLIAISSMLDTMSE
jgi:thioredoxin-related protein